MIIPIKSESGFQTSYVLCLRTGVSEASLLRRAQVRVGTYAGELVTNLHDGIFRLSIELKSDYAKYYALEYSTFAEYVWKRFLFSRDIASAISAQLSTANLIIYFHPSYWFIEDAYGQEFLERLFEPRRSK
jgi:hypothetical protein